MCVEVHWAAFTGICSSSAGQVLKRSSELLLAESTSISRADLQKRAALLIEPLVRETRQLPRLEGSIVTNIPPKSYWSCHSCSLAVLVIFSRHVWLFATRVIRSINRALWSVSEALFVFGGIMSSFRIHHAAGCAFRVIVLLLIQKNNKRHETSSYGIWLAISSLNWTIC